MNKLIAALLLTFTIGCGSNRETSEEYYAKNKKEIEAGIQERKLEENRVYTHEEVKLLLKPYFEGFKVISVKTLAIPKLFNVTLSKQSKYDFMIKIQNNTLSSVIYNDKKQSLPIVIEGNFKFEQILKYVKLVKSQIHKPYKANLTLIKVQRNQSSSNGLDLVFSYYLESKNNKSTSMNDYILTDDNDKITYWQKGYE